jgi:acetone carboxylase gamma subunit
MFVYTSATDKLLQLYLDDMFEDPQWVRTHNFTTPKCQAFYTQIYGKLVWEQYMVLAL